MAEKRKFEADRRVPGLFKVLVENPVTKVLEVPRRGRKFRARKRILGHTKQTEKWFDLRDEAIRWLLEKPKVIQGTDGVDRSPMTVEELWDAFRARRMGGIRPSTATRYQNLFRLYFSFLTKEDVRNLTPQKIDGWLDWLKSPENWTSRSKKRLRFKHELDLLRTMLNFYDEYFNDPEFRMPIKRRHYRDCALRQPLREQNKDFLPEEFNLMLLQLQSQPYGDLLVALASTQYWHALRISEAAGLSHEDIRLDFNEPQNSSLRVHQSVFYPRKKGLLPYLQQGFKNSRTGLTDSGAKISRLMPGAFDPLAKIWSPRGRGPIFVDGEGNLFTYKRIYNAYQKAQRRAGLIYRGTHVLRHGGSRAVLDETGDLTLAQQHLGNSSMAATQIYAKRSAKAWDQFVMSQWEKDEEGFRGGAEVEGQMRRRK